jgi:putative glutamine amidotransferase
MIAMVKIAIAGTPEGAANFIDALNALGAEGFPVLEEENFDQYDGLILPGGADIDPALFGEENWGSRKIERERDLRQLEILDIFVKSKKPILGVCKGHQLLNIYFGGKICQNIPEFQRHQWMEADQAHGSRCQPGCFLEEIYGLEFPINSAHHQAVTDPMPCFRPIQWAEDGVLEGMVHQSLQILGLQWHPERMCQKHRRADTVDGLGIFAYYLKVIAGEARFL